MRRIPLPAARARRMASAFGHDPVPLLFEEIERRGTWPEDQEKWTKSDSDAYWNTRKQVEYETEIGAAFNRAFYAEEAWYQKLEPLYHQIRSFSAETPEGRVLQMRVIATQLGFECDELWG
jgi:hypothetical protein